MTGRHGFACAVAAIGATLGCSDDGFLVVTVARRPAVQGAATLRVALANEGSMRTEDIALASATFPATFSVSTPGRTGELGIQIDALDAAGLLVGRGAARATIGASDATVLLDTTDFVVNTNYADDQFPSDDFEAHGFQLAAAGDGTWTVAYREGCATPCNMFARRFDRTGRAVSTKLAAGTNGFAISTRLTTDLSTPAIATAGETTLAVWDYREPSPGSASGVSCRAIDATGGALTDELTISTDPATDVVSIAPLSNRNFAVTWTAALSTSTVRSAIVRADCTTLAAPVDVSATMMARRPAVAAGGEPSSIMYAWIVDGGVKVRIADNTNAFVTNELDFLPATPTERVEFVRVAPLGAGFAVVVRWAQISGTEGAGRIELYRTTRTGGSLGAPVIVTTRSGTDFDSSESFGLATRPDGMLMVVWHACLSNGDSSGCGVFARAFRSDGAPAGDELTVPTTTAGDQRSPSVTGLPDAFAVVWKDASGAAPDPSGSAVRARIVYPPDTVVTP